MTEKELKKLLKVKKVKIRVAKYLACIWCGKDIPKDKPYAMYCSEKCRRKALGQRIKIKE